MSDSISQTALQELLDKQAIRDVLSRYCRGLDRMDKQLARRVWWEGGTAFYDGIFEGTGHEFIDWVWEAHAPMERHSHQITNVLTDVAGDRATSESYVTVVLWTLPDAAGAQTEIIGRGRYLDRWEKRDGVWAIEHRIHLLDMQTVLPLTRGDISAGSTRDPKDLSFEFIARG
ncbi:MAG: nuclear transport factor 2 family protein [Deltaproteobacteria bacterium]|nr:nuclear transport factor 2 family protein [Deltaproteobacteria bacterium]